jgi:predicted Zn finger-like uncharacterized protein
MIVTCQNCEAHFSLNDGLVKKTGSKVRCSKCKHVFMIYPDKAEPPEQDMLSTDEGSGRYAAPPQAPRTEAVKSTQAGQQHLGDTLNGETIAGGDLDLSEIEKMLATDGQGELDDWISVEKPDAKATKEKSVAVESSAVSDDALDLSEIEKMFGIDQDLDDADITLESEPEDLVFDFEESAALKKEPQKELGDFDIADIEKMLEEEMVESETDETGDLLFKPDVPSSPASSKDQKEEDAEDLFALSDIDEVMEKDAVGADEEEGLTLEMDDDFKPEVPASSPKEIPAIEELDFSDLEGMMKANDDAQLTEDEVVGDPGEALTFALDSDDRFETESVVRQSPEPSGMSDLSKLDDLFGEKGPEVSDEVSLELDIADMAPVVSTATDTHDLELQFGEADVEDQDVADTTVETDSGQPMETEDLDLEFNDEELSDASTATEETEEYTTSSAEEEKVEEPAGVATEAAAPVESAIQPAKARQSRKPLVIVLILVLLVGAGIGVHLLFGDRLIEILSKNVEIPFLAKLKKPAIPDAGNLKITTIDIDSVFVENATVGRLFVISGKARNGYDDSRSMIRITGKLYSKGKQLVNTETAYCGNVMTSQELSTLSIDDIKKRLGNRKGDNDANVNIKPGEDRPFMVVFSKLTENLEEFTLEVAGSDAAVPSGQK